MGFWSGYGFEDYFYFVDIDAGCHWFCEMEM